MTLRTGNVDLKTIREMKQEEDQSFYYLGGNACDMRCQSDWFNVYGRTSLATLWYDHSA